MNHEINSLRMEVNVIWFILIFIIFITYGWLRLLTKRVKSTEKRLEELKGKTVVNEANVELQKRRKK